MRGLSSGVSCFLPLAKPFTHAEQLFVVTSRSFHRRFAEMRWETTAYLRDGRELNGHTEEILGAGPDFYLSDQADFSTRHREAAATQRLTVNPVGLAASLAALSGRRQRVLPEPPSL